MGSCLVTADTASHFHTLCTVTHTLEPSFTGAQFLWNQSEFYHRFKWEWDQGPGSAVCTYGWLQSNPTVQFRVWHHLVPSTPSHTNNNIGLKSLSQLTTAYMLSRRSGTPSLAAGVSVTEPFQKLSSCHTKVHLTPGWLCLGRLL